MDNPAIPRSFRDLLDNIQVPAYLLDRKKRRLLGANIEFCKLIGYTEQELLELPSLAFLMPEYVEMTKEAIESEVTPERPAEWHFRKKDGNPLVLHCSCRLNQLVDRKFVIHEVYFVTVIGGADGRV